MALDQTFDTPEDAAAALKARREEKPEDQEEILQEETLEDEPEELEPEAEFEEEDQPQPALEAPIGFQDVWEDLDDGARQAIVTKVGEADALLTRKTEELAETLKTREAESQAFAEERARLAEVLETMAEVPEEPDPDLLDPRSDKYDPDKFNELQADRRRAMKKAEAAEGELTKIREEKQAEEQTALAESQKVRNEYLAKAWPDVLDPAKGQALQQGILAYAEKIGMNLEVMPYLTGPMLHALEKARRYEELESKGLKKRAPKTVRPSAPSSPSAKRSKKLDQMKKEALESGDEKKILAFMKENRAARR